MTSSSVQGSTDFADAYSYDLVIDIAEALNAPSLLKETFVIEGHASAEGDYGQNLLLSQDGPNGSRVSSSATE